MRPLLALTALFASFASPLAARQGGESRAQRSFIRLIGTLGDAGYNRVEGLPLHLGLEGRSPGRDPFRGRGLLIGRTNPATGLDQVGYVFRAEKLFLGPRRLAIGAQFHSQVSPVESRGIAIADNTMSGALFKRDYRDYFNRQGFVAFATYSPQRSKWSAMVQFRAEDHDIVPRSNASSLFDTRRSWRFQTLVAVGRLYSVTAAVRFDDRARRRFNRGTGWEIEAGINQGFEGDLSLPPVGFVQADLSVGPQITNLPTVDKTFTTGRLDVRRYNRIGNARLNLRFVTEGTLADDMLPPQLQYALGGRGTLPGYSTLQQTPDIPQPAVDCRARALTVAQTAGAAFTPSFYPLYGCDRYALLQVQVEGYLGFRIGRESDDIREEHIGLNLELVPRWILFFDAAQAWAQGDLGPFPRSDEDRKYDAGGGIALGDLGFYLAVPLKGDDDDVKFVVRLGARF